MKTLSSQASLGDHNIKDSTDRFTDKVDKWITHEEYNPSFVENDIALVRLEKPVKYNENIKPACLPKSNTNMYIGSSAVVSGWGTTKFS